MAGKRAQLPKVLPSVAECLSMVTLVLTLAAISLAQVGTGSGGRKANPPVVVIKEFPIPTAGSSPLGIIGGPDANLWFTESEGNKIGRITPAGVITEFPLPTAGSTAFDITAGRDGALWFTEPGGNKIGRITPAGVITEFPLPTTHSFPEGITAGPDGNMWFTESSFVNKIGRITPAGVITEFPLPTAAGGPTGITAGPDGNVWFAETVGNKIGRIVPSNGVIFEFPVPTAASAPYRITAGGDGALWFTEKTGQIGRIFPVGAITEFPTLATPSDPTGITPGPDGNIWFIETAANKIGRVRLPNPAEANRAQQTAPIQLGTSGSNVNDVSGGGSCCVSGTLGALVKDAAGNNYILSNNHVIARSNQASLGEAILQRGYIDTVPGCSGDGAVEVAHLSQFVPLDFNFSNDVDAAIAEVVPGEVDPSGAILGIGAVSAVTAVPVLGMRVLKAGRTTGKTRGSIDVIHLTVVLKFGSGCAGGARQIKFVEQFGVLPFDTAFSAKGDSGSLILKQVPSGSPNPVGLLFAAAPDGTTLGNPIDKVLTLLNVSIVGSAPGALDRVNGAPAAVDPQVEAAARVQKRYDDFLLSLPEVVGHGVGYSRSGSGKVVIRLFLRKTTDAARQAAPAFLEGIPVELQETGEFRTIPICGKRTDGPPGW